MHNNFVRNACLLAFFVPFSSQSALATENVVYKYDALGRLIDSVVTGGPASGIQTVVDYDPSGNRSNYSVTGAPPALAISNSAAVVEGGTLLFAVTRSGNSMVAVTVGYTTSDATATSAGKFRDYVATNGILQFAAGETLKTISVVTISDARIEDDETMAISLSTPSAGAVINVASATGVILQKTF